MEISEGIQDLNTNNIFCSHINNQVNIKLEPIELCEVTLDDMKHENQVKVEIDEHIKSEELTIKHEIAGFDEFSENLDDTKSEVKPLEANVLCPSTNDVDPNSSPAWFFCIFCTFITNSNQQLDQHSRVHNVHANHMMCNLCKKLFVTKFCLEAHLLEYHQHQIHIRSNITHRIYQCSQCSYQTLSTGVFKLHLIKHKLKLDKQTFDCKHCCCVIINSCNFITICHQHFYLKQQLDSDILSRHSDDKNQMATITNPIYACVKCSFRTMFADDINKHLQQYSKMSTERYHNMKLITSKIHKCPLCSYKSVLLEDVEKHLMLNQYNCKICKQHFDTKIKCHSHILSIHVAKKNVMATFTSKILKCSKCSFRTVSVGELQRHNTLKHKQIITDLNKVCDNTR